MAVYVIVFFLIALFSVLTFFSVSKYEQNKIFGFISYLIILCITFMRSDSVGGDLVNYKTTYLYWSGLPFSDALRKSNTGFVLLNWITGRLSHNNFYIFMAVCGFISITLIYMTICRFSPNRSLSLLVFLSIWGYSGLFSGIRSTLAMAVVFFASIFLFEKKYKTWFVLLVLASLIHLTAVVSFLYLPVVFAGKKMKLQIRMICMFLACMAVSMFGIQFLVSIYKTTDYTGMVHQGEGIRLFLFILGILILISRLQYKGNYSIEKIETVAFNSCVAGEAVQVMAFGFSLLNRLTVFFWIYFCILLPVIAGKGRNLNKWILCLAILGFSFTALLFGLRTDPSGIVPYQFFFEV